jgi:hypothetical protein
MNLIFLTASTMNRPPNMLNDHLLADLTWGDLEEAWTEMVPESNRPLVRDFVTALWKESVVRPETHNLRRILAATALLAGSDLRPGLAEPSPSRA